MRCFIIMLFTAIGFYSSAQEETLILNTSGYNNMNIIQLADTGDWVFKKGHNPDWSQPEINTSSWNKLKPAQMSADMADDDGRIEGWFRLKFKLDDSFEGKQLYIDRELWSATDIFINDELLHSFGDTGRKDQSFTAYNPEGKLPSPIHLETGREYLLAIHIVHYEHAFMLRERRLKPDNLKSFINLHGEEYFNKSYQRARSTTAYAYTTIAVSSLLMVFFWILVFRNPNEAIFRYVALLSTLIFLYGILQFFNHLFDADFETRVYIGLIWSLTGPLFSIIDIMIMELIIKKKIKYMATGILIFFPVSSSIAHVLDKSLFFSIVNTVMLGYFGYLVFSSRRTVSPELKAIIIGVVVNISGLMAWVWLHKYYYETFLVLDNPLIAISILSIPISLLAYVSIRFNSTLRDVKDKAHRLVELSEEKKEILANQNVKLEKEVTARTVELNKSLEDLKSTQSQLIQSEKMASLGELTAGIAHEIQNPLNFVNNFSDLNKELIEELKEAVAQNDQEEVTAILADLTENESKVNHHGKRAENIVKSMLQHSRTSSGEKELTDINALADEYLRLAYHGLRAKDKNGPTGRFNADFKCTLDETLPKVKVIPQDIGRVLLNLINNAFQAVAQKDQTDFKPEVTVSTKNKGDSIEISVKDNGPGIPDEIKEKIFQPFFTTKPTGQGTGLGLSMSYDIVTKGHGGTLVLNSDQVKGTSFTLTLPVILTK